MTEWSRIRLLDTLTEVRAYALEPVEQPTEIERTYGYYAGWHACLSWLQDEVPAQNITTAVAMQALLSDAERVGEMMAQALAFTADGCAAVEDVPDAAVGDQRLRVLLQYVRGWQAAVEKTDERLVQVADHVFEGVEGPDTFGDCIR